jgi:hypothetical protein
VHVRRQRPPPPRPARQIPAARTWLRIDSQSQRIDFRSRSLFGLFDFGKNRSRMQAFATRFEQQSRP